MWLSQVQVRSLIVLLALLPMIPSALLFNNMTESALQERDTARDQIATLYQEQLQMLVEQFLVRDFPRERDELENYLQRIFGDSLQVSLLRESEIEEFEERKNISGDDHPYVLFKLEHGPFAGTTVLLSHLPEFPSYIEDQYRKAWLLAGAMLVGVVLVGGGVWYTVHRTLRIDAIRSDLLNTISHEIKTPVSSIQVLAESLEDGALSEETQKEYASLILAENQRVGELANRFLTISRLDAGQIRVRLESCDLSELLQKQVAALSPKFEAAGGSLSVKCSEPVFARADRQAMEIVVGNVLENALKYGGEPPRAEVEVSREGRWVEISISDSGGGVPNSERRAIFRKFYRSDRQLAGTESGAGLGLAICKRFMRLLRGNIRLAEERNTAGARFVLSLPACEL